MEKELDSGRMCDCVYLAWQFNTVKSIVLFMSTIKQFVSCGMVTILGARLGDVWMLGYITCGRS
jgi:hypothetical protein